MHTNIYTSHIKASNNTAAIGSKKDGSDRANEAHNTLLLTN